MLIQARDLRRTYSQGGRESGLRTEVLRGVDLDLAAGSFTALVGPSGSGKTTLLNLVGALDTADGGSLTVAGTTLAPAPPPAELLRFRRERVGFVFQSFNLLPTLTAAENVEIALEQLGVARAARRGRVMAALERVGLADKAGRFPAQLSGGEQQRAAIARALAKEPPLILADEPTGSLDEAASAAVVALMRRLGAELGTTFLLVTHDPAVAGAADAVLRLAAGRIAP